jgi:ribosomal protein S24E
MSSVNVVDKVENTLLGRLEVTTRVSGIVGTLSRKSAVDILSKHFGVDEKLIIPIKIKTSSGKRDSVIKSYIYNNYDDAKRQLQKHLFVRLLGKEEREKIKKELASRKAGKKQAAAKGGK